MIDIGINITNKQFNRDVDKVVKRAIDANVNQMILTGTTIEKSVASLNIAKKYPNVLFSTAGIHPHYSKDFNDKSISILRDLLKEKEVVSVGECGLDFDRDFSPRPIQEKCFEAQLQLSIEVQKPLFYHERAAFDRFISITDNYLGKLPNGVVHCFTGSLKDAKVYLDKGFYIGFTGAISDVRRFEQLKDVIQYLPLDRIMVETDAPFMLPKNVPKNLILNERRCEPSHLPFVISTIADFKKLSIDEVTNHTEINTKKFFKI